MEKKEKNKYEERSHQCACLHWTLALWNVTSGGWLKSPWYLCYLFQAHMNLQLSQYNRVHTTILLLDRTAL